MNRNHRDPAVKQRETLLSLLSHLVVQEDTGNPYEAVCRTAVEGLSTDSCTVFFYDDRSNSLWHLASYAVRPEAELVTEDIRLKINGVSRFYRCLSEGGPVVLGPGDKDPVIDTSAFQRVVLYRLAGAGRTLGLLAFAWLPGSPVVMENKGELFEAVVTLVTALALQSRLSEELERSEERYRALMEGARDLVFVLDAGGRFLYVNPRCRDMLGYEPEEMLGRYFGEFVTGESWARTISALRKAVSSGDRFLDYQWVISRRDGKLLTLEVRASVVLSKGEVLRHQGIARDVSEVRALHEELARRDRELGVTRSNEERMRGYLRVATLAQEEERARIARELHDGPVQYLVALRRQLDLLERLQARQERQDVLKEMDELVDRAIQDLREFSRNLRPPILDDFGLGYAVEWLADQVQRSGIETSVSVEGKPRRLDREIEVACFRIAQEALANCMKHAKASKIEVKLFFGEDAVEIRVNDNGRGFEYPGSLTSLARAGQMGLVGMFERAELLGGSVSIRSEPAKGTSVLAKIPLRAKDRTSSG